MLLVVFSPFWVPLVMVLAASALAVYLSIWMVVVALWATVAILILCAPLGVALLAWFCYTGHPFTGLLQLGAGLVACGLGLFAWFGVLTASKALVGLAGSFARWIKSLFVRKGAQNHVKSA